MRNFAREGVFVGGVFVHRIGMVEALGKDLEKYSKSKTFFWFGLVILAMAWCFVSN
jgi:hypothetical protein